METTHKLSSEKLSVYTASASLAASIVAATACVGPLLAIALGVTGLGWLSQFSTLTIPASVLSVVLVLAAIVVYKNRKSSCASRRKHFFYRWFLVLSAATVVSVNVFEYIILPNLA